ncbi:MAG: 50S ribosomal protein L10 [Alphaproteobacteria bacterium]|nr:50S ribosomal protein L10 [Alphaproteobacteria bacterium]MBN2779991.1 50S ribosomal protein L10 [Alphaproteobacteria bacterium]
MLRSDKQAWIADMHTAMTDADAVYVAHYQGLTVSAMEELRSEIRKVGGQVKVSKNRLMRLALDKTDYAGIGDLFTGATIVVHGEKVVDMARVLVDFVKENESLKILGGASGAEILSMDVVKYYATLPSLDGIRGTLVGLLQAPASKLARVFKAYADKS